MRRAHIGFITGLLLLASAGAAVAQQKPCAGYTGAARTRCLQTQVSVDQSIAQDRNDALRAYNRAYNAASVANQVAKGASRSVPGGGAAYGAGQAVGSAVVNRGNR
jgi:hypothetical protein